MAWAVKTRKVAVPRAEGCTSVGSRCHSSGVSITVRTRNGQTRAFSNEEPDETSVWLNLRRYDFEVLSDRTLEVCEIWFRAWVRFDRRLCQVQEQARSTAATYPPGEWVEVSSPDVATMFAVDNDWRDPI